MSRAGGIRKPVARLAPWIAAVLLLALPLVLPNRATVNASVEARHAAIAIALRDAPYLAGDWVGEDAPVPREAQELLRPNAILSRSYERLSRRAEGPATRARLHLLVVHCADARDMIGHYPPICYPSSGWNRLDVEMGEMGSGLVSVKGQRSGGFVRGPQETSPDPISADPISLPVRIYRFAREREQGGHETITVLSAFVLPGGTVTREIGEISGRSERLALAVEGVAQIQIISPESDSAGTITAAGDLLGEMPGLLETLGLGGGGEAAR